MRSTQFRRLVASFWLACLVGCAGSPLSSKTEDEVRLMMPVPICLQRLPRPAAAGSIVALRPAEYWSMLLPSFDSEASTVDLSRPDCSGRLTLAEGASGAGSVTIRADQMVLGSGSDGFKIAWLPVRSFDTKRSGLLALLRQRQEFLEVYALGIHQGVTTDVRFALERMGPALVVTALEERCSGEGDQRLCDAACTVYLMHSGQLQAQARFPVDHTVKPTAAAGAASSEYRFSASADYRPNGVVLTEQLSVREKGRGEVRSVDLERTLRLQDGRLVPSTESLWVQTAQQLGVPEEL